MHNFISLYVVQYCIFSKIILLFIDKIKQLFPHLLLDGSSVTYFFKKYLNAPDELVTAIGRIYENQEIEGAYSATDLAAFTQIKSKDNLLQKIKGILANKELGGTRNEHNI